MSCTAGLRLAAQQEVSGVTAKDLPARSEIYEQLQAALWWAEGWNRLPFRRERPLN